VNISNEDWPVCATITHLDGIVLARSSFHSSMNYRSVMIFRQSPESHRSGA